MLQQEPLDVREAPGRAMGKVAELWKPTESGRIVCTACARYCKIGEGQVGLCGIRGAHQGKLWLYTYGKVITGHVDPIEKKPVTHYRPGSKIFSIATTGCNWLCHPAGTSILMADGDVRPVEAIRPGDAVWSVANADGMAAPDIVTRVGERAAKVLRVSLDGSRTSLLGTPEHPVLTARGWRTISELQAGDEVVGSGGDVSSRTEGAVRIPSHTSLVHREALGAFWRERSRARDPPGLRWRRVRNITRESERERVYSFECIPFHNYLASDVVVHNCRYCFLPGTKVLTSEGQERIESIFSASESTDNPEVRTVRGLEAFTHRRVWRRIISAFQHEYSGPILEIHPAGMDSITCTPDHRVYAAVENGPIREVRADALTSADRLAIPRPRTDRDGRDMHRWIRDADELEVIVGTAAAIPSANGRSAWRRRRC